MTKEWLSRKETAKLMSVSADCLDLMVRRKLFPTPTRTTSGGPAWSADVVARLVADREAVRSRVMSAKDLATRIAFTERTLRRWVAAGRLPRPSRYLLPGGGSIWGWPREALVDVIMYFG